jgi:hypothetical protein
VRALFDGSLARDRFAAARCHARIELSLRLARRRHDAINLPPRLTFVKTIKAPASLKAKYFATAQEAQRKDVERAFGVLQARFQIVRQPTQLWDEVTLRDIMTTYIILHNMIIEDERPRPY